MRGPHRARFIALLERGAAARDMHDSNAAGGFDGVPDGSLSPEFLARELDRVQVHLRGLCAPLDAQLREAHAILDVGCGTGGTTVALALSAVQARVEGIDACADVLDAARVRAQGHGVGERVAFAHVAAGAGLPFADGAFDLVTCVSVLEFVGRREHRAALLAEMLRVLRPGGRLYLATPSPWRLRELHSRRWFGDWRRTRGFPWASPGAELRAMLPGCEVASLSRERLARHARWRHLAWTAPLLGWALPWQRVLARKPEPA